MPLLLNVYIISVLSTFVIPVLPTFVIPISRTRIPVLPTFIKNVFLNDRVAPPRSIITLEKLRGRINKYVRRA